MGSPIPEGLPVPEPLPNKTPGKFIYHIFLIHIGTLRIAIAS